MADFEDRARAVEKDLKSALDESRAAERRLDDNRRNLEIQLDNANEEIQVQIATDKLTTSTTSKRPHLPPSVC